MLLVLRSKCQSLLKYSDVRQMCALSSSLSNSQRPVHAAFFFLIVLLFKTINALCDRKGFTHTNPLLGNTLKKLLKLMATNVNKESTSNSNKHWGFGLQASLFQNCSEYLQRGSCVSALESGWRKRAWVLLYTHTQFLFYLESCLSKDYIFFSLAQPSVQQDHSLLVTEKYSLLVSP